MYLEYFKLKDFPFRVTPDPAYLFMSSVHARAKAYMDFSLWKRDSIVVISGEIGSGKTTLIENMLGSIDDNITVARIHQTQLDEDQFLEALLVELGFKPYNKGKVELLNMVKQYFRKEHDRGRMVLIVIDEAQNLSPRVLEEVRLLSGLETHTEKMMNVLLVGQPELNETLTSPGLEQLSQRVRLRFHLRSLNKEEVGEYIQHRLKVAGAEDTGLFSDEAVEFIFRYTGGSPRLINILCDTALTGAFVEDTGAVTKEVLHASVEELQWQPHEDNAERYSQGRVHLSPMNDVPPKVVVTCEDELVGEFLLDKKTVLIGRAPNCDIYLDDNKVSGTHAQLVHARGNLVLSDLGSTNGTFVDGRPIKKTRLHDGDSFFVTRKYRFEISGNRKAGVAFEKLKSERDATIDTLNTDFGHEQDDE